MVLAKEVDVTEAARPEPGEVILVDVMAPRPKLLDDSAQVERVENDDGVGDQVETGGLKVQRFVFQAINFASD